MLATDVSHQACLLLYTPASKMFLIGRDIFRPSSASVRLCSARMLEGWHYLEMDVWVADRSVELDAGGS